MTYFLWAWAVAAIVFGALEMLVPTFGLIFAASSAVLAGLSGLAGARWEIQIAVFAAALLAQLLLLRPRLVRRLQGSAENPIPSRSAALVGKRGRIVRAEDEHHARATFGAEDWAVESRDRLAVGDEVEVARADGVVIEVRKIVGQI